MPDIKTSSTKLATPWQTTLHPSNTFSIFLWACTALSVVTLWHCPVPLLAKTSAVALTVIGSVCLSIRSRAMVSLRWQQTELQIHVNGSVHTGQLASGSYYCSLVMVLAIKDDNGRIYRVPVWHDSVDANDYSWLLMRLKTTLPQTLL